jgi:hypothetical protein
MSNRGYFGCPIGGRRSCSLRPSRRSAGERSRRSPGMILIWNDARCAFADSSSRCPAAFS